MCISADVNFVASAAIATIGIATLRHVRHPRAVLFAAIPLFFAIHQFTEAFVWLGKNHEIRPEATGHVTFLFILYAQGILAFLMPLAVFLIEPAGVRKVAIGALTAVGGVLCAYVMWAVIAFPSEASVEHHSLVYHNVATAHPWVAAVYVLATCGTLVLSSHRVVMWFGILNVLGVFATMAIRGYAFTSVWCLYAAVVSVILYWQFSGGHIDVTDPNSKLEGRPLSTA